ncbi:MAG TPA: TetR family transcriptional regulator C-terminal domain-containing protein [bacterium]|nr:TetR family transcriptional regulator C-terminal domain-containing protein [bacterium]
MRRNCGNRERILEAAARLFHEHGFQPTSLDDIINASGVCRSNLYYHFRSKEELGLVVLDYLAARFGTRVIEGTLRDERRPARQRLEQFLTAVTDGLEADACRRGCPFGNLAAELAGGHPRFRERLSGLFRQWEDAVVECLREGVRAGEFREDLDVTRVATVLVSQFEGAVLLSKTYGNVNPVRAAQVTLTLLESR